MIFQAKQVDVTEDPPLRIQEERVASLAGFQLLHLVRGHGMQKPGTVLADNTDLAASRQIEPGRMLAERYISRSQSISKIQSISKTQFIWGSQFREIHRRTAEIATIR